DVQDTAVGREIGEQLPVRRELRSGALRIVEQHATGNNRWDLGRGLRDGHAAEQSQREYGHDQSASSHAASMRAKTFVGNAGAVEHLKGSGRFILRGNCAGSDL